MANEIVIQQDQLEIMLEKAAIKGAKIALKDIGLSDDEAIMDVKELRGLLDSWRKTKQTIWLTVARWATMLILSAIVTGLYFNWGK